MDNFALTSGIDIPFPQGQLIIHQPSIKELSIFLEESNFLVGCELLLFSKENLEDKDKNNLSEFSDFEIIMSMMGQDNLFTQQQFIYMKMIFTLLFPEYKCNYLKDKIIFIKGEETGFIDKDNFGDFQKIFKEMFCLDKLQHEKDFNPEGPMASAIAKKLAEARARKKKKNQQNQNKQIALYENYISILSIGLKMTPQILSDCTVYQLSKMFERYTAKVQYDFYLKAKLAGAKDMDEVQNWMSDLNSSDDKVDNSNTQMVYA